MAALIASDGCSRKAAAESEGLGESTVRAWEDSQPGFLRAMKKARALQRIEAAKHLREAAIEGDTAARIFRAKCLDPDVWTERRPEVKFDPASFAEALRQVTAAARGQDGLEPPGT